MTEQEWLTNSTAPLTLLGHVDKQATSDHHLYFCLGLWQIHHLFVFDPADMLVLHYLTETPHQRMEELERALVRRQQPNPTGFSAVLQIIEQTLPDPPLDQLTTLTHGACYRLAESTTITWSAGLAMKHALRWYLHDCGDHQEPYSSNCKAIRKEKSSLACDLIRELFGNPFRSWVRNPDFLGGGLTQPDGRIVKPGSTAHDIAMSIHLQQEYGRLPYLADALEEDGIDDGYLLEHLRGNSSHRLGCWALELLLPPLAKA